MSVDASLAMTRDEVEAYLAEVFPQILLDGPVYSVAEVGPMSACMSMRIGHRHLRPGGTVSGPTLMTLADLVFYAALLSNIGRVALAVTTNLNFNFLRKPEPRDLVAQCRLLKLGKRLAVGEALIFNEGSDQLVCHATGTYSIPPPDAVS